MSSLRSLAGQFEQFTIRNTVRVLNLFLPFRDFSYCEFSPLLFPNRNRMNSTIDVHSKRDEKFHKFESEVVRMFFSEINHEWACLFMDRVRAITDYIPAIVSRLVSLPTTRELFTSGIFPQQTSTTTIHHRASSDASCQVGPTFVHSFKRKEKHFKVYPPIIISRATLKPLIIE